ncbi:unnamed protein product [Plutella xylostella]|uniref:protein xylosyltransferase n=1 Tax=Plutella xylostella TaxID=51655 RepID=A0A8S4D2L3_PLUXY|nr:unnamed protein product [Plutella xylostella]
MVLCDVEDNDNTINGAISFGRDTGDVSARKSNFGYEDDEDLARKSTKKHVSPLRLQELDFQPPCEITSREAISAIHRAKTQNCKRELVNKTCLIQGGTFYPIQLKSSCPNNGLTYGKHLGCYQDEKKLRLLSSFYGNYANTNSRPACLDICVQAGFPYAGVQYGTECFCGDTVPPSSAKIDAALCDMKCPADAASTCGGYFTMNVFETGVAKFQAQTPASTNSPDKAEEVRIVFLLTLNGRALRQVHRLINALYRTSHYFYIHVDARQDYLHRELSQLEQSFPNIKLAKTRFSTIWGGASLLQMLLTSMRDILTLGWQWDFVINLSESDFPIKSLENLEKFLSLNKGLNFVKSHGREVQRFIKKQGLDKTFIECETHMWRVGERRLPRGVTVDGGSDWVALSPRFVAYVAGAPDPLLAGLHTVFRHTLLPAESFFHTALRNSDFCNTYVDNNLHVTNWKRKLGCKCQYKHVVDWCGCSPNDFRTEDWPRIQGTQDHQLFFARKFEPVINQEIITRVEKYIGFNDHHLIPNLDAYWQSIFNTNDLTASTDDILQTHANAITRQNVKILHDEGCSMTPLEILEINSYYNSDVYKGNIIRYKAIMNDNINLVLETWYKPRHKFTTRPDSSLAENIKTFRVSSEYDQKETTFRNFANILGPFSEPVLLYELSPNIEKRNLTLVWVDPAGVVADVTDIQIEESNLTNFIKPNLNVPILPGVWRVSLRDKAHIVQTYFLISPLEYFSGKEVSPQEASIIHSGSHASYKNHSNQKVAGDVRKEDVLLLKDISQSNSKRVQHDLLKWIDSLNALFYNVLGTCVDIYSNKLENIRTCGSHSFKDCKLSSWSSLSPDPKGHVGKLNNLTGRLERV